MKVPTAISFTSTLLGVAFAFQPSLPSRCCGRRNSAQDSAAAAGRIQQPIFMSTTTTTIDNVDENTFATSSSSSSLTTSSKKNNESFDNFDYTSHWYPVTWAQDVPLNQPIRVTLFDVDYVLAKTPTTTTTTAGSNGQNENDEGGEVVFYAMLDSCPHKKVALSEGRITDCGTPNKKYLQCSYHGWTFDGESGQCMEIPQTVIAQQSKPSEEHKAAASSSSIDGNKKKRRREDATVVAVQVVHGMVWLHPSYTPLEALAAMERGALLPPPRIPEMDMDGYRVSRV
ncbi:hypothetical protein ACHAXR_001630, partial [Thalassiosira sp. AJA248-18]